MIELVATAIIFLVFLTIMSKVRIQGRLVHDWTRIRIQDKLTEKHKDNIKNSRSAQYKQATKITNIIMLSLLVVIVVITSILIGLWVMVYFTIGFVLFTVMLYFLDNYEELTELLFPVLIVMQALIIIYLLVY